MEGVDVTGVIKEDLSAEVPFTPNSEDGELTMGGKDGMASTCVGGDS